MTTPGCIVQVVSSIPWPAMSLDLNPIEHVSGMLCRRVQAVEPPAHNLRQLGADVHRELRRLPQQNIRRLTGGIRRMVEAVI